MATALALLSLVGAVLELVAGLYVLWQDRQRPLNRLAAYACFASAGYLFCEHHLRLADTPAQAAPWLYGLGFLIPLGLATTEFVLVWTGRRGARSATWLLGLARLTGLALLLAVPWGTLPTAVSMRWGVPTLDVHRIGGPALLTTGWLVAQSALWLVLGLRFVASLPPEERRWHRPILLGVVVPGVLSMLDIVLIWAGVPWLPMASLYLGLGDLILARAVVRQRLLLLTARDAAKDILRSMAEAVAITDRRGHILHFNPALRALVGGTGSRLVGQPVSTLFPELCASSVEAERHLETTLSTPDGVIPVRVSVAPVSGSGRERLGTVLTAVDLRAQRENQAELEAARARAEASAQAKAAFLANMSHEIRTPMNGVIGMISLLEDTPLSPAQAEHVRVIRTSGEALLTIIDDVLDLSKIEAGRLELEARTFSPESCARDALAIVRPIAQDKGLALRLESAGPVPPAVVGDEARVRQILLNLLSNAVKFTCAGEVVVRVDAADDGLRFSVQDTGIGIDPAHMERLFRPFSQVDASISRRFGGTGLGLTISQRLAELMGGALTVTSSPGVGSTFVLQVPLQLGTAPAHTGTTTLDTESVDLSALSVLVAEDNPINQRVIQRFLERLGVRAELVEDGAAALERLSAAPYSVVLMDVQMPVMDGLEATRRLRAASGAEGPYVVALTASAMEEDRERCRAAGMDDFLAKPIRPDALRRALRRAASPR
jgi:PAS domain S-box-containing protein